MLEFCVGMKFQIVLCCVSAFFPVPEQKCNGPDAASGVAFPLNDAITTGNFVMLIFPGHIQPHSVQVQDEVY